MTTLAQKIEAVGAFAKAAWWWLAIVGLALGGLLLVRSCNRASRAENEAATLRESIELERAGFLLAKRTNQAELDAAVAQVPALQAEIDRLSKELGKKPKVVIVEKIVTAPSPAEGLPRPKPLPGEPCPECKFAAGDTGQIRVDEAHVETAQGNEVVVLSAQCWRLTPGPETRILSGTASAPLSRILVEAPPPKPGPGGAILVGYGTSGIVGTIQGFTSPLLWRFGLTAAVTAGPGTDASRPALQLQGGIIYRE
jgi:hypothetical protein